MLTYRKDGSERFHTVSGLRQSAREWRFNTGVALLLKNYACILIEEQDPGRQTANSSLCDKQTMCFSFSFKNRKNNLPSTDVNK